MNLDLDPYKRRDPEVSTAMDAVDEILFQKDNLAVLKDVARAAKEALEAEGIDKISKDNLVAAPDGTIAYAQMVSEGHAADDRIKILFVLGSVDPSLPVTTTTLAIPPRLFPMQEKDGEIRWITDQQHARVESDPEGARALGLDVAAYREVVAQLGGSFGYDVTGFYKGGEHGRKQRLFKATDSIARNKWRVEAFQAVDDGDVERARQLANIARGTGAAARRSFWRRRP